MKTCTKCKKEFDLSEFPVQIRKKKNKEGTVCIKKGRRAECRLCYNEYFRLYMKDKEKHQQAVKRNKGRKHLKVTQNKLEKGCSICGYKKCSSALHYHHIDTKEKEFAISWAVTSGLSQERIDAEIEKCILVCSNCHCEIEESKREIQ